MRIVWEGERERERERERDRQREREKEMMARRTRQILEETSPSKVEDVKEKRRVQKETSSPQEEEVKEKKEVSTHVHEIVGLAGAETRVCRQRHRQHLGSGQGVQLPWLLYSSKSCSLLFL